MPLQVTHISDMFHGSVKNVALHFQKHPINHKQYLTTQGMIYLIWKLIIAYVAVMQSITQLLLFVALYLIIYYVALTLL